MNTRIETSAKLPGCRLIKERNFKQTNAYRSYKNNLRKPSPNLWVPLRERWLDITGLAVRAGRMSFSY